MNQPLALLQAACQKGGSQFDFSTQMLNRRFNHISYLVLQLHLRLYGDTFFKKLIQWKIFRGLCSIFFKSLYCSFILITPPHKAPLPPQSRQPCSSYTHVNFGTVGLDIPCHLFHSVGSCLWLLSRRYHRYNRSPSRIKISLILQSRLASPRLVSPQTQDKTCFSNSHNRWIATLFFIYYHTHVIVNIYFQKIVAAYTAIDL